MTSGEIDQTAEKLRAEELDGYAEFHTLAEQVKAHVLAELEELRAGTLHDELVALRERAEQQRIDDARKAEMATLVEAQKKIDAERAALQADRDAIEQARQSAEAEAKAAHAAIETAQREAMAKVAKAEQDRLAGIEAEKQAKRDAAASAKAAKEEKARLAALSLDREALLSFAVRIEGVIQDSPKLKTKEGGALFAEVVDGIRAALEPISERSEEAA